MVTEPSRAIKLFGTDEAVEEPRVLKVGPLTAEFEAGNLRYIKFHGIEMIRAISYIVRDKNWGTYNPKLSNLKIEENTEEFRVTYEAEAGDQSQIFRYSAVITGNSQGTLRFEGTGTSVTDFLTNRTGFVVLHPIEGVAGAPARVEHVDGRIVDTDFPALIDPIQPMMNLRAITHEFSKGLSVRCLMEGDTFEMEDQRNWTDASYKTYVRPLALPWPYTIPKGETLVQAVSLSVSGALNKQNGVGSSSIIKLEIGEATSSVPPLGTALDPDDLDMAEAHHAELKGIGIDHVICHYDTRRGHNRSTLERQVELARSLGKEVWLEAIITRVDGWEDEVTSLGVDVAALGRPFSVIMLSPASDMKCTLPGSVWPPCPPADALFIHARKTFGSVKLAGGMFSYFTELNRKRPPVDYIDFVSFTTSALVHAGDDRSVTESLEAMPHIARSVTAISGMRPWVVGPSAIGMRDNPYGAEVAKNPHDIRQAMNRNDPRQRGLIAAAFDVGYFSHMAYGGAKAIALGGFVGPFGVLPTKTMWRQPFYDEEGGVYPVYHIRKAIAEMKGAKLRILKSSRPRDIMGISAETLHGQVTLIANLTGSIQKIDLGNAFSEAKLIRLNAEHFEHAARETLYFEKSQTMLSNNCELDAYETIKIYS